MAAALKVLNEDDDYLLEERDFFRANAVIEIHSYRQPTADEIYVYEHESTRPVILEEIKLKKDSKIKKSFILFNVSILIFLGLMLGVRYASITEFNYRNQANEKVLDAMYDEIKAKETYIDAVSGPLAVAEYAKSHGMQIPEKYQVVYVDVPAIDITELRDVELSCKQKNEGTLFSELLNIIKNFLGLDSLSA